MQQTEAEELQAFRVQALLQLMSDISEDCWCAGWISGNENALYRMAFDGAPRRYGMSEVGEPEIVHLRDLAEKTGMWGAWDDEDGVIAVDLKEFAATRTALRNKPDTS